MSVGKVNIYAIWIHVVCGYLNNNAIGLILWLILQLIMTIIIIICVLVKGT